MTTLEVGMNRLREKMEAVSSSVKECAHRKKAVDFADSFAMELK